MNQHHAHFGCCIKQIIATSLAFCCCFFQLSYLFGNPPAQSLRHIAHFGLLRDHQLDFDFLKLLQNSVPSSLNILPTLVVVGPGGRGGGREGGYPSALEYSYCSCDSFFYFGHGQSS